MHKKMNIYASSEHLAATLIIVALPFLLLLGISRILNLATTRLLIDVLLSSWRLLIAYGISAVLAWIWAISFYHGKRAVIALPVFDVLQSFPAFATLPLATLLLGRSNITVIFFLIITIVWPIFFSLVGSLKLMKQDWADAVKISNIRGIQYLKKFLLPVSIPGLITGSIIGIGEGWEALVATEIIVRIQPGLGNFFNEFSYNPTVTALGIFGLLFLIFILNKLVWFPLLHWSHKKLAE